MVQRLGYSVLSSSLDPLLRPWGRPKRNGRFRCGLPVNQTSALRNNRTILRDRRAIDRGIPNHQIAPHSAAPGLPLARAKATDVPFGRDTRLSRLTTVPHVSKPRSYRSTAGLCFLQALFLRQQQPITNDKPSSPARHKRFQLCCTSWAPLPTHHPSSSNT
jgi:hypothetical protein